MFFCLKNVQQTGEKGERTPFNGTLLGHYDPLWAILPFSSRLFLALLRGILEPLL